MNNPNINEVSITVKLERGDLSKFMHWRYYKGLGGKIVLGLGILIILSLAIVAIPNYSKMGTSFFLAYFPTIFVIINIFLLPLVIIMVRSLVAFKSDPNLRKEQVYKFVDSGLTISSTSGYINYNWDEVWKVNSSKHFIAIFIKKNKALIIPKRVFRGDSEIVETLYQVFRARINKRKLKLK